MKKYSILVLTLILTLIISGCGNSGSASKEFSLVNHENDEVTLPNQKPALIFFFTSYTWGLCQTQLVELHNNLEQFNDFDMNIYAISHDQPNELKILADALNDEYPRNDDLNITFISDPNFELIDYMDMQNGDTAFRGYGILDTNGNKVFSHVNDHWGEELDKTLEKVKAEYNKMESK